jgi:hypothetical protein
MRNNLAAVMCLAASLSGCVDSGESGSQTFTFSNKAVIVLHFRDVFGQCKITDATLKNISKSNMGYIYSTVTVTTPDKQTSGTIGLNFFPTVPGGTSGVGGGYMQAALNKPCSHYTFQISA